MSKELPSHPRTSNLIGHEQVLSRLTESTNERQHHSFIFSGMKGVGKATAAYKLAEHLLDDPNLVRAASHPDMMTVEAEIDKASGMISTEQIRRVVPFLAHTPARGGFRVVIIDALDEVNINGANAMLKTIEEPPEKAIILMISHGTRRIIPTIRSRVQIVPFAPLSFEQTQEILANHFVGADDMWLRDIAMLADGAPGQAIVFAKSGAIDLYKDTCQMLAYGEMDWLKIQQIAEEWGGGGMKNSTRRKMGRILMARLLSIAAGGGHQKKIVGEEAGAISFLNRLHSSYRLAELYQETLSDLLYAEQVNLNSEVVYSKLFADLLSTAA